MEKKRKGKKREKSIRQAEKYEKEKNRVGDLNGKE